MKKWEYCEADIYLKGGDIVYHDNGYGFEGYTKGEVLDQYGQLGWELVGFEHSFYIFKRELDTE